MKAVWFFGKIEKTFLSGGHMDGVSKDTPLAIALRELRKDDYNNAKATISNAIGLRKYLNIFELKAFLIMTTKDKWGETKESDIVLMAFGLLDGYYYDTKYIENINQSDIAKIGDRREKYLRYGPYVRTKDGKRYASYDGISNKEKRSVKNALGKQDGRLLNELAGFIYKIDDIKQYIANAEIDPRYTIKKKTKSGRTRHLVRLPKQCSFLDDFPAPREHSVLKELSETKAPRSSLPPVTELFPSKEKIILIPGEIFGLKVAILPNESVNAPLSFVSRNPNIVTVSTSGMLKAEEKPKELLHNIEKSQFLGDILGKR